MCFICGLEREMVIFYFNFFYKFDRFADGFDAHIQNDHELWFYIYYIFHVNNKNYTDHNGIESYVFE